MIARIGTTILLLEILLLMTTSSVEVEQPPQVKTTIGRIQGFWHPLEDGSNQQIAIFFGIPYAKPPMGSLRFEVRFFISICELR